MCRRFTRYLPGPRSLGYRLATPGCADRVDARYGVGLPHGIFAGGRTAKPSSGCSRVRTGGSSQKAHPPVRLSAECCRQSVVAPDFCGRRQSIEPNDFRPGKISCEASAHGANSSPIDRRKASNSTIASLLGPGRGGRRQRPAFRPASALADANARSKRWRGGRNQSKHRGRVPHIAERVGHRR
jgi:hypothetical protein